MFVTCHCCLLSINDPATTQIYTLSLHDALPITSDAPSLFALLTTEEVARFISPPPSSIEGFERFIQWAARQRIGGDRQSTRLNSSHVRLSYAVLCLKEKKRPLYPPCIAYMLWPS